MNTHLSQLHSQSQRSEMDDEELTMMALEIMKDTNDPYFDQNNINHYSHHNNNHSHQSHHSHHTHHSHQNHTKMLGSKHQKSVHKAYNIHINSPVEKSIHPIANHPNHKNKISPNVPYQIHRHQQQHQNQLLSHQQEHHKRPSHTQTYDSYLNISDGVIGHDQQTYSASSDEADMVYVDYPRSIQPSNDTNLVTLSQLTTNIDEDDVHEMKSNMDNVHHHVIPNQFELTESETEHIPDNHQMNHVHNHLHHEKHPSIDKITIVSGLSTNDSLRNETLPPIPMTPNININQQPQQQPQSQLYDIIQNVDPNVNINPSKSTNRSSGDTVQSKHSVANKYGNKKRGIKRFTKRQKTQSYHGVPGYGQDHHHGTSVYPQKTVITYSATYDQATPSNHHHISQNIININTNANINNNIKNHTNHNTNNGNVVHHAVRYVKHQKNKGKSKVHYNHNGGTSRNKHIHDISDQNGSRYRHNQWKHHHNNDNISRNQRNQPGPGRIMSSPPRHREDIQNKIRQRYVSSSMEELENDVSLPTITHIDISTNNGSKLFAKRQNQNKNMPPKSPNTPPPKHKNNINTDQNQQHSNSNHINGNNTLSPQSMAKDISATTFSTKSPIRTHDNTTSQSTLSPVYSTGAHVKGMNPDNPSDETPETEDENIIINDTNKESPASSAIDTTPNISPFQSKNRRWRKNRNGNNNIYNTSPQIVINSITQCIGHCPYGVCI